MTFKTWMEVVMDLTCSQDKYCVLLHEQKKISRKVKNMDEVNLSMLVYISCLQSNNFLEYMKLDEVKKC